MRNRSTCMIGVLLGIFVGLFASGQALPQSEHESQGAEYLLPQSTLAYYEVSQAQQMWNQTRDSVKDFMGDKWEEFTQRIEQTEQVNKILDDLGLERYCCRRMFISHVPLIKDISEFGQKSQ